MDTTAYVARSEFEELKKRLLELEELYAQLRYQNRKQMYPIPKEMADNPDFLEGMEDFYHERGTILRDKDEISAYFAKKKSRIHDAKGRQTS